jgi:hypothetical protein
VPRERSRLASGPPIWAAISGPKVAAIAAITLAQINGANVFTREVRREEGLPDPATHALCEDRHRHPFHHNCRVIR